MSQRHNAAGQPIGADLSHWRGAKTPQPVTLEGRYCTVTPLTSAHAPDLFSAYAADSSGTLWTYMPVGPFTSQRDFTEWTDSIGNSRDPLFFAIIDHATGKPGGIASFLRIQPDAGVIEVGFIAFAPILQKTPAATESMGLMMAHAFDDLGYRRYEWKCDALNEASKHAAKRLGFSYDGLFRQATVYKGRNRDTAWFSVLDSDWPEMKAGFAAWLAPGNFDPAGIQRQSLALFRK